MLALALVLLPGSPALADTGTSTDTDTVTVFAAASLKDALEDVAAGFEAGTARSVRLSFAGSSALARQIERGAPADVFISASADWMDALEEGGLIEAGTRFDLVANTLVLVANRAHEGSTPAGRGLGALDAVGPGKPLAMALVDAVPAGIYGRKALASLGLWDALAPHVVQADNVRAALAFVASGEAPLGIVYASDAQAEDRVVVVAGFPPGSHPPIVYPAAIVAGRSTPAAQAFLAALRDPATAAIFERHGFAPVP